jgi:hypothetical protein
MSGAPKQRLLRTAQALLLAAGAAVTALLWDSYGISWDEYVRSVHGEAILSYFVTVGADRTVNQDGVLRLYTALPDLLAAALYAHVPEKQFAIRHLVSALFALATVPALYGLARLMGRPWAGPVAGVILLSMPVFFGHAFINSKDIPLACAFAWAMLALAWLFQDGGFTWSRVIVAGMGLGFPLAVRPGVWPLLVGFLLLAMLYTDLMRRRHGGTDTTGRSPPKLAAILVVSWLVMVLVWPWAHENPLVHPLIGIAAAGSFPTLVEVLFAGELFSSDALPRRFLVQMLGLQTPIPVVLFSLPGLWWAAVRSWRDEAKEGLVHFLLLAWFVVPIGAWTALTPNLYDNTRHFLFILPALALLAALGVVEVVRRIPKGRARFGVGAVTAMFIILPVRDVIRLHPYEYTYFNALAGGVGQAVEHYETDYWVTSYRKGAEWISREAADWSQPVRVLVAANELSVHAAAFYLPEDATVCWTWHREAAPEGHLPPEFDFYLSSTRHGVHENFPDSPVAFSVGRAGATFAVVRERSSHEPEAEPVRLPNITC